MQFLHYILCYGVVQNILFFFLDFFFFFFYQKAETSEMLGGQVH